MRGSNGSAAWTARPPATSPSNPPPTDSVARYHPRVRFLSRFAPVLALWLVACNRERPPQPAPPAPRMELSGCAAVLENQVCEVSPSERAVRLWIEGGADRATVRIAGAEVPAERAAVQGGLRL